MPAKKNKISLKRKIILGSFILLLILPLFVRPAKAFETPNFTYQSQFEEALSSGEMNLQSFVNETLKAIMGSISHLFWGTLNPFKEATSLDINKVNLKAGLIPATLSIMSNIYAYPPASGINYFAQKGRDLKIIQPTYAEQDAISGFNALSPLQPIWKTFRNFSYLLFVLILVGLGFAIMFRLKISPQAVVTLQGALPRIVIALILITFSYAIVGFIFDTLRFTNSIIEGIFNNLNWNRDLFSQFPNWQAFIDTLKDFAQGLTLNAFELDPITGPPVALFQQALVGFFVFEAFIFFLLPVIGFFANFIFTIIILIVLFRCLWTIIKSFTMIIINLIFAPLRIMAGVFPGSNAIADWFKDLIANAAVLPTMLIFFGISTHLIFIGATLSTETAWWLGMPSKNLIPWTVRAILPFCGVAILMLAPKVSEFIQSFITKKPFQYGAAIGEAMGPIRMAGMAGYRYGAGTTAQYLERVSTPPVKGAKPTGWRATAAEVIRTTTGVRKS